MLPSWIGVTGLKLTATTGWPTAENRDVKNRQKCRNDGTGGEGEGGRMGKGGEEGCTAIASVAAWLLAASLGKHAHTFSAEHHCVVHTTAITEQQTHSTGTSTHRRHIVQESGFRSVSATA